MFIFMNCLILRDHVVFGVFGRFGSGPKLWKSQRRVEDARNRAGFMLVVLIADFSVLARCLSSELSGEFRRILFF